MFADKAPCILLLPLHTTPQVKQEHLHRSPQIRAHIFDLGVHPIFVGPNLSSTQPIAPK